jgi:hypothetical protein
MCCLLCYDAASAPAAADVDIDTLPRRRTDNARIFDKTKHTIKLYTSDAGTKLLRRKDGSVERQNRLSIGSLPVAYTGDGSSDILYIMDRAVTSYNRDAGGQPAACALQAVVTIQLCSRCLRAVLGLQLVVLAGSRSSPLLALAGVELPPQGT